MVGFAFRLRFTRLLPPLLPVLVYITDFELPVPLGPTYLSCCQLDLFLESAPATDTISFA